MNSGKLLQVLDVDPRRVRLQDRQATIRDLENAASWRLQQPGLLQVSARPTDAVLEHALLTRWQKFCEIRRRQLEVIRHMVFRPAQRVFHTVGQIAEKREHATLIVRAGHGSGSRPVADVVRSSSYEHTRHCETT